MLDAPAMNVPRGSQPLPLAHLSSGFERLALIADVHGNVPALAACLADVERAGADAVAFLGCLTWGPEPQAVAELARSVGVPTYFLRGNGERAVLELAAGDRAPESVTDEWMVTAHAGSMLDLLATWPGSLHAESRVGASLRLCHGSPRSDIELLTPGTSATRIEQACADAAASTIAHGHTHLQYNRPVAGRTVIGVGSVGLPYGGERFGARWTLLTGSVDPSDPAFLIDQRTAPYDIELAIARAHYVGYPGADRYERFLREPPTVDDIVADAEARTFSD